MFVRIKDYLINTKEITVVNKRFTAGGATIVIHLKNDHIEIYFYDKEEERDAAFEFLATTLLKEEA